MKAKNSNMPRRTVLALLVGAAGSAQAFAQSLFPPKPQQAPPAPRFVEPQRPTEPEPIVLSGPNIGFQVEGVDRDGVRVGRVVVLVDGKWVDTRSSHGIRTVG